MLKYLLHLVSFMVRFLMDLLVNLVSVFGTAPLKTHSLRCRADELKWSCIHDHTSTKTCLNFCFALNENVNLISQQGHLCSYRIHECMLKTAIKGHLSSAKLTAALSIYATCA